jgi:feruloyl esterase
MTHSKIMLVPAVLGASFDAHAQSATACHDLVALKLEGVEIANSEIVDVDKAALRAADPLVEPASTNLSTFSLNGAKLIFFHGDSDQWFLPLDTLGYYKSLSEGNGGADKVAERSRMFLVPGMSHCGGGPSLDHFDMLGAVVDWVEKGTAPESVIATGQASPAVIVRSGLPKARSVHRNWGYPECTQLPMPMTSDVHREVVRNMTHQHGEII